MSAEAPKPEQPSARRRQVWSTVLRAVVASVIVALIGLAVLHAVGALATVPSLIRDPSLILGYSRAEQEPVTVAIVQRLPLTIELLVASFLVALVAGVPLAILVVRIRSGLFARIVMSLATAVRCTPFFWLVLLLSLLAAIRFGDWDPFGWASLDRFSFEDHLAHLVVPACLLSLLQVSFFLEPLQDMAERGLRGALPLGLVLAASLTSLAERLPEILAAETVTEIAWAWPGEGRLFWNALLQSDLSLAISIAVFMALVVLMLRLGVNLLMPAGRVPGLTDV